MKFAYVTDTHLKGINPINRKGDYYLEVMNKIREIINIAKKMKCEFIIHGGDLYDSAIVSNQMIDELVDLIEKSKIIWYILIGNHDEIGHSWELSKGSSLAHIFNRSDYIKELDVIEDKDCLIQGFKYYHNIEQDLKEKGIISIKSISSNKIAIVHALITKKPLPENVMHLSIKDLKTDFDYIFIAHNHEQYGLFEQKGVKFISLGCLGRTAINELIMPTIAIFDSKTGKLDLIPLKCAKPGNEVFDLEKAAELKNFDNEIDKFIASLDTTKIAELNLMGIIEFLAKENNLDEEIKQEIIKRIGVKND